ncbi:response regulator [uncultured Desulfuromusa sp.]|uniref:response regulator n=1 Tax=uncultured Desulfuromusa sp. TaxID=219183 RepID=UPI002AA75FB6|nr:response regulator [uncultured Desulfuromusa sp.]
MISTGKKRILVADGDILNLATLIGTLKDNYHIVVAKDAPETFKQLKKNHVDMILLETRLAGTDGFELCRQLKADLQTKSIPVIFITAQSSVADEEKGFEAGAVDYIAKPFNAPTVTARIKHQLKHSEAILELQRLHQLALDANPNTGLPGNNSIRENIQKVIDDQEPVCIIYADLDHFKAYNDNYGFAQGDHVIVFTANVIKVALQLHNCHGSFLGHIGGDDFVFIVPVEKYAAVAEEIINRIDGGMEEFYNAEDFARGYVVAINREGEEKHHPVVSLSMGGINLQQRKVKAAFEVIDICTEMKTTAKKEAGSNILICQRK